MGNDLNVEEFDKKLAELEGLLRIQELGYKVKDPELERYFKDNKDNIYAHLSAEYESAVENNDEGAVEDIAERMEWLGFGRPD